MAGSVVCSVLAPSRVGRRCLRWPRQPKTFLRASGHRSSGFPCCTRKNWPLVTSLKRARTARLLVKASVDTVEPDGPEDLTSEDKRIPVTVRAARVASRWCLPSDRARALSHEGAGHHWLPGKRQDHTAESYSNQYGAQETYCGAPRLRAFRLACSKKGNEIDQILIETTGVANPAPVVQTFYLDELMGQFVKLDGVVTIVDAKNIERHLDAETPEDVSIGGCVLCRFQTGSETEAVSQIAFADRVIINKTDLVESPDITRVESKIRQINGAAQLQRSTRSSVNMNFVLGIGGYDLDRIVETIEPDLLQEAQDHSHSHGHDEHVEIRSLTNICQIPRAVSSARRSTHRAMGMPMRTITAITRLERGMAEWGKVLETAMRLMLTMRLQGGPSGEEAHGHSHGAHDHGHAHHSGVGSVSLYMEEAVDLERVNDWFAEMLTTRSDDIYRMKGVLNIEVCNGDSCQLYSRQRRCNAHPHLLAVTQDVDERYVFHGVHQIFE
eukprot:scaffold7690_cov618-Prasinococcus_capsulatus_cf.AAC.2